MSDLGESPDSTLSLSIESFLEGLSKTHLLGAEEVAAWLEGLPQQKRPQNGLQLAEELVQQKRLTPYQAAALCRGQTTRFVFGRYILLEKIGSGGMGEVYKARHRFLDRIVAVKLLHELSLESPEAVERFRREAKAAGKLTHPNIVTTYDADFADGRHLLVMEYIQGEDLAAMAQKGAPPPVTVLRWILDAARGLCYAHQQGVIHRDVKPSNLLLNEKNRVKILDLGIALLEKSAVGEDQTTIEELTNRGVVIGTVDYMAPEQALDNRRADARSDIYSLGCTLYTLLARKPVYEGATIIEKIIAHRENDLPSLRSLREDVSEGLDYVVRRMLAKNPDDRYQNMSDVIGVLESIVDSSETVSISAVMTFTPPKPGAPSDEDSQKTCKLQSEPTRLTTPPAPAMDSSPAEHAASPTKPQNDELAKERQSLERFIDGCGAVDHFIDWDEENRIFRKGGEFGLPLCEIEQALSDKCAQNGWTRQSALTENLTEKLFEATTDDGVIDRREFESVIEFAVRRKMPRRAAEEHCVQLILDNQWQVKEGWFDKWFRKLRNRYQMN